MAGKQKCVEVPGNAYQSQVNYQAYRMKVGDAVLDMGRAMERLFEEDVRVKAVRFKGPAVAGGPWLAVVTIDTSEGGKVAFSEGDDFEVCVRTLSNRMRNGSIKWKDDEYAS